MFFVAKNDRTCVYDTVFLNKSYSQMFTRNKIIQIMTGCVNYILFYTGKVLYCICSK